MDGSILWSITKVLETLLTFILLIGILKIQNSSKEVYLGICRTSSYNSILLEAAVSIKMLSQAL